jgi:phage host-nuclease inhibitor protein Gam
VSGGMVVPRFKSRADADKALAEMIHFNRLLASAVAERDAAIQAVETQHHAQIESLTGKVDARRAAVEAWARKHRAKEFGKQQSLELANGTMAFRVGQRSLELLKGWTWKECLAKLTGKWKQYVRLKPEVNKALLLNDTKPDAPLKSALDAKRLKEIGLAISQDENFDVTLREGAVKVSPHL